MSVDIQASDTDMARRTFMVGVGSDGWSQEAAVVW